MSLPEIPEVQPEDFSQAESDDSTHLEQAPSRRTKRESSQVARGQSRAVCVIRLVTIVVLMLAAWTTTGLVFWYAYEQEVDNFEQAFEYDASKVLDTYESNALRRLEALEEFATSMTQFAISRRQFEEQLMTEGGSTTSFPFVTLPDFERRATYTLESAEVLGLIFHPRVSTEEKEDWESYSVANAGWIKTSQDFQRRQQQQQQQQQQQDDDITIQPYIFGLDESTGFPIPESGPGPYYPIWQTAPVFDETDMYNFNMYQTFPAELDTVFKTQRPLTSDPFILSIDPEVASDPAADAVEGEGDVFSSGGSYILQQFLSKAAEGDEDYAASIERGGGISSVFFVPVFDVWNEARRQVAGVLAVMVYWQLYLSCLLPDVEETLGAPLTAVMENTCDESFSFELRGSSATFLGEGDWHDTDYDHLMMESGYDSIVGFNTSQVEILPSECLYNLRLYPTQEMEDVYLTDEPIIFAAVIFSVFIFTAAVFVIYDRCVQRRHRIVNATAVEQRAVVNSLFPDAVRDQVVDIVEKNNTTSQELTKASTGPLRKLHWKDSPNKEGAAASGNQYERLANQLETSTPVANLYPDCTVLFCDIAGFTAWSGKRGPSEVFKLLEAIYGAFDRIAKKKKVFKVETIGDCYVAVTGLPQPQAQHAVIMAKFANDCMTALSGMMHVLVDKLGEDTATLTMRFGLHSGPVTAGVLRGDRARFQLFGDTVNTASRMESNGQKGRIQVSQSTADLLIAAGKQDWVKPREDKIQAKGKGLLQTYWVEIGSVTTSSGTSGTQTTTMNGSLSEMSHETKELLGGGDHAALSRQQHEEYKHIIEQLKQEVG